MKKSALTFTLPQGVEVPDGKQMGDTFQAMGTFRIDAGGKCTLTEVDGEPIDGSGDQPNDQTNTSADDDSSQPGMMAAAQQNYPGPGGQ